MKFRPQGAGKQGLWVPEVASRSFALRGRAFISGSPRRWYQVASALLFLLGVQLLWLLAACQGVSTVDATATPAATATATPTPAERLARAGEAMMGLESAAISIGRAGGVVYLDAEETLVFNEASGNYQAPDRLQATVKVLGPGIALEMGAIQIGEQAWLTNPLTGQWEAIPGDWGFDMLALFSEQSGWETLLRDHVRNVQWVGETTFGEATRLQLRATLDGQQARLLTAGISGSGDLDVDFWIDPNSYRVVQIEFETPGAEDEMAQWRIRLTEFDEPVTIEPPQ